MLTAGRAIELATTALYTLVVVAVAVAIALSFAWNWGADDLRQQARIITTGASDHPRTPWGMWFAQQFGQDVPPGDPRGLADRGEQLGHRAERLREMAGAGSLLGLLVMLLSVGKRTPAPAREVTSPPATTTKNGNV